MASPEPRPARTAGPDCVPDEMVSAWASIVRGCVHINRALTEQVEGETGLPPASFLVLSWLLHKGEPAPLSTLARHVAFSSGGFTKVADRLEQAGLIKREPSPTDRRVTNAVLTSDGRALARQAHAVYSEALHELVLQHVELDQLQAVANQISRLSDAVPPGI